MGVLLWLRVRGHAVGQHAECAALLHGFAERATDVAIGQNDLSGHGRLVIIAGTNVDEIGDDAGVWRAERHDREHVAIRRELENGPGFADDGDARVDGLPRRGAQWTMLD